MLVLTSCQPSLAIESEFTKPCFISGIGCPHPPPREPGWFDWLFRSEPAKPLDIKAYDRAVCGEGMHQETYGANKYSVLECVEDR